ncbi:MAG: hypothetical protein ABI741_07185 [Ferruginibacter sp.]
MDGNNYFLWDRVGKIVSSFPGVHEKPAYGTPAFYVEKKLFTRLKEDGETLVVYNNDRDEWIASNPDVFFFTDHYKNYPALLIDLKTVSKPDLEALLIISWKIRASKKILQVFEK